MMHVAGNRAVIGAFALGAVGVAVPAVGALPAGAATTKGASGVVTQALNALSATPTFTLNGFLDKNGRRVAVLVRATDRGKMAEGRIAEGPLKGAPLEVARFRSTGTNLYLDANQHFWASASSAKLSTGLLRALGGHWVELPAQQSKTITSALSALTNPAKLAGSLLGGSSGSLALGPVRAVRGTRARAVVDPAKQAALYVAVATGRPVEIQATGTASRGAFVFTYPKSVTVTAPAGARTLTQIAQQTGTGG